MLNERDYGSQTKAAHWCNKCVVRAHARILIVAILHGCVSCVRIAEAVSELGVFILSPAMATSHSMSMAKLETIDRKHPVRTRSTFSTFHGLDALMQSRARTLFWFQQPAGANFIKLFGARSCLAQNILAQQKNNSPANLGC